MAYYRCVGGSASGNIDINVTLYGAKGDNITIADGDGTVIATAIFGSDEISKVVTLSVPRNDSVIYRFISNIAKALDGTQNDYRKDVVIDRNTTEVKVMPDKAVYWYGNECEDISGGWTRDGYEFSSGWTGTVTKENNYITLTSTNQYSIIGTANKVNMDDVAKVYVDINVISISRPAENRFYFAYAPDAKTGSPVGIVNKSDLTTGNHILNFDAPGADHYIETFMRGGGYYFNYRVNRVWMI